MRRGSTSNIRALISAAAVCLAVFLGGGMQASEAAAEKISGYVDEKGRVIFVNDPAENPAETGKPKGSAERSGRRMLASATATELVSGVAGTDPEQAPSSLATATEPQSTGRDHIEELVEEAASRHRVDPELVHAIVQVESNYNPYAVSNKGARGLMQLIPATARRFGVVNSFDPQANLDGGIRYLKYLMGMFNGDLQLSLAAYNAGEMAVARSQGVPPYRETRNYIRKIGELYPIHSVAAAMGVAPEPQIVRYIDSSGVVHFSNTDLP